MSDPWAFGWSQVFTIIGFAITIVIAVGGFRSFGRWQREQIEEKRIDTAVDALVLIREAKWVFDNIRSPMSFDYEWKDMPKTEGEDDALRRTKGSYFAILKRVQFHREFFDRAYKLQIRCGALFGQSADDALLLLQKARREVEVSAQMLVRDPVPQVGNESNRRTWDKFRTDVWAGYGEVHTTRDTVSEKLEECSALVETICRPVLDRHFGRIKRTGFRRVLDWFGV
jgi:hypothetical protein